MDQYKEEANIINEKITEIDMRLSKHKEKLIDLFKEIQDPKHDLILLQFDEILNSWSSMVEAERIMLNRLAQETLMNSIEVIGLPEEYAKDIGGVSLALSKLLHIPIVESYIKGFERIGDIKTFDPVSESGNPRPLVVHLINQNIKKRILTVAESVVLSVIGSDRPMYITEHLTLENNQLFKKARHEALQHHINNVWIEDGKILVRRSDVSLIYEIRCEADIKRMAHY